MLFCVCATKKDCFAIVINLDLAAWPDGMHLGRNLRVEPKPTSSHVMQPVPSMQSTMAVFCVPVQACR